MDAYRSQERFDGEVTTIVSNNCNYVKGAPGEPVLVSWDDAITLFHEFGHALHGLASNVTYPSLSGTNVDRDYVEFPSQLLESGGSRPGGAEKVRAPLPRRASRFRKRWCARSSAASKFNKGFENVEYLSSALVDMRMHLADPKSLDVAAFERETLVGARHAARDRDAPSPAALRPPLQRRFVFGRLLQLPVGRHAERGCVRGVHRRRGRLRQGGGEAAARPRLLAGNTVDPELSYRAFRGAIPASRR
jgi:peptidyl-dipeptidase Dcp